MHAHAAEGGPRHRPEFRFDLLTRQWVAITAARQGRPNLPGAGSCPFCVGGQEASEPYDVKSFANRWPALVPGEPIDLCSSEASADAGVEARGAAEVVLYSPRHEGSFATLDRGQARRVVDLWAERSAALLERPEIEYVLVFENCGAEVGATISHPHGQIYAFPFIPPVPQHEAQIAAEHGCPVCSELDERDDLGDRIVEGNETFVAFARRAAAWPFELLIVPRSHTPTLEMLEPHERDDLAETLRSVLSRYRHLYDEPLPYMLWIHPGVHLHVHVVTTRRNPTAVRYVAAGELGSGTMFNPVSPEVAAKALREASPGP
jgi:UDPglucose--hexose-1-phosphate uridylyltransferase